MPADAFLLTSLDALQVADNTLGLTWQAMGDECGICVVGKWIDPAVFMVDGTVPS